MAGYVATDVERTFSLFKTKDTLALAAVNEVIADHRRGLVLRITAVFLLPNSLSKATLVFLLQPFFAFFPGEFLTADAVGNAFLYCELDWHGVNAVVKFAFFALLDELVEERAHAVVG